MSNPRGKGVSSQLVVIVDDSVTNRKILEWLASSLGGRTVAKSFADPDAPLGFCSKNFPDLVLLASASAQGEAADFLCRLRAQPARRDAAPIPLGPAPAFYSIPPPPPADPPTHLP